MGVDLEIQSTRLSIRDHGGARPGSSAARRRFEGRRRCLLLVLAARLSRRVGVECGFDKELRGTAGAKSVLVNNVGYRQTENVWSPAEPGTT